MHRRQRAGRHTHIAILVHAIHRVTCPGRPARFAPGGAFRFKMPTISLCMICGNEQAIIARCLESALDCFDELCLVRAIGTQAPDNTEAVARAVCEKNGKAFRFSEYSNHKEMPHVDDFGAARQASFDLATSEWCLWLDCDDYLTPINALRIREAANVCKANAVHAVYRIEAGGGEVMRERLIRRNKGRWMDPIHETCSVSGASVECPQIEVYHNKGSDSKRSQSSERNARILAAQLDRMGRAAFYGAHEMRAAGNPEDSIRLATAALMLIPEDRTEDRYAALLELAIVDKARSTTHLLNAVSTQPHRREALAYLCQDALSEGKLSDAVSWFRMMDALPLPSPIPWTHQGIWYGEGRNLLRVRLLRATGKTVDADIEHARHMDDPKYAELCAA
jgi:Glycosyl transferase family 2